MALKRCCKYPNDPWHEGSSPPELEGMIMQEAILFISEPKKKVSWSEFNEGGGPLQ